MGHAADENHVVDSQGLEAGVCERLLRRADRPLEQVVRQLLELRARELEVEVPSALGVAVTNGRLICVVIVDDSSIFAFSAAS